MLQTSKIAQGKDDAELESSFIAVKNAIKIFKGGNDGQKQELICNGELERHVEIVRNGTKPLGFNRDKRLECSRVLKAYNEARKRFVGDQNTEIPQGYAGIASRAEIKEERKFIGTYGIAPCVGFTMYSPSQGKAVLVHFDDELSVTDKAAKARCRDQEKDYDEECKKAQEYYSTYINVLFEKMGKPDDVQINIITTKTDGSEKLGNFIEQGAKNITANNPNAKINHSTPENETESCLLSLRDGAISRYEGRDPKAVGPNKSIEEALYMPSTGLELCCLKDKKVIPQDLKQTLEFDGAYMRSKPKPAEASPASSGLMAQLSSAQASYSSSSLSMSSSSSSSPPLFPLSPVHQGEVPSSSSSGLRSLEDPSLPFAPQGVIPETPAALRESQPKPSSKKRKEPSPSERERLGPEVAADPSKPTQMLLSLPGQSLAHAVEPVTPSPETKPVALERKSSAEGEAAAESQSKDEPTPKHLKR